MHLLPPNLAALSDLAAKESTRFAMNGVHLTVNPDNTYRAMATDSKCAAIVTGPCEDAAEFPAIPGMESAPNGATEGLVPSKVLRDVMKPLAKNRRFKPVLHNAAVVLGETMATFGTTDLDVATVTPTRLVDGRFPPLPEIMPNSPPTAVIALDPDYLAKIAKVAAAFTRDDGRAVVLELRGQKPIVIRAQNGDQTFAGLLMPLTPPEGAPADPAGELHDLRAVNAGLESQLESARDYARQAAEDKVQLNREVRGLQERIDALKEALETKSDRIVELGRECNRLRDELEQAHKAAIDARYAAPVEAA